MLKILLLMALLQKGNNSSISAWSEGDKLILAWALFGLMAIVAVAILAFAWDAYRHPCGGDISRI